MKKAILIFALLQLGSVVASEAKRFQDKGGISLTSQDAVKLALNGGEVWECRQVALKASKTGTSIALRPIKQVKAGAK